MGGWGVVMLRAQSGGESALGKPFSRFLNAPPWPRPCGGMPAWVRPSPALRGCGHTEQCAYRCGLNKTPETTEDSQDSGLGEIRKLPTRPVLTAAGAAFLLADMSRMERKGHMTGTEERRVPWRQDSDGASHSIGTRRPAAHPARGPVGGRAHGWAGRLTLRKKGCICSPAGGLSG